MQTRNKIQIIVQGPDENALEYSVSIEDLLAQINRDWPSATVFAFPTSASNGRQTMNIQWFWHEEKEYDNVMIKGLVNGIMVGIQDVAGRLGEKRELEVKDVISKKIHDFLK